MREAEIRAQHFANAKRNALLFSQFEFLNTRGIAFEALIKSSTLWQRIRWFLNPGSFLSSVDAVQARIMAEEQKKRKEAEAKPKLTIVGANGNVR